jgi:hypothetical protein
MKDELFLRGEKVPMTKERFARWRWPNLSYTGQAT